MFLQRPWLKWQPIKVHQLLGFNRVTFQTGLTYKPENYTIAFHSPSRFKQSAPQTRPTITNFKLLQKW